MKTLIWIYNYDFSWNIGKSVFLKTLILRKGYIYTLKWSSGFFFLVVRRNHHVFPHLLCRCGTALGLVCIPIMLVHVYVRTQIHCSIHDYYQIEREMHVTWRKKVIRPVCIQPVIDLRYIFQRIIQQFHNGDIKILLYNFNNDWNHYN